MQNRDEKQESEEQVLKVLRRALATIPFGSVEILIHNSKVVQIEVREKIRP